MSRLHRGLWYCEARMADGSWFVTQPAVYDIAAITAPMLGEVGAVSAILRRIPASRAPWEARACYEASDPPRWGVD